MPERPPDAPARNIELCGDLILRDLAAGDEPPVRMADESSWRT
jgi:hypothetical protein